MLRQPVLLSYEIPQSCCVQSAERHQQGELYSARQARDLHSAADRATVSHLSLGYSEKFGCPRYSVVGRGVDGGTGPKYLDRADANGLWQAIFLTQAVAKSVLLRRERAPEER